MFDFIKKQVLPIVLGILIVMMVSKIAIQTVLYLNNLYEIKPNTYWYIVVTEDNPWGNENIIEVEVIDTKDNWVKFIFVGGSGNPQYAKLSNFCMVYSYCGDGKNKCSMEQR